MELIVASEMRNDSANKFHVQASKFWKNKNALVNRVCPEENPGQVDDQKGYHQPNPWKFLRER